jgi:hypothetical protein
MDDAESRECGASTQRVTLRVHGHARSASCFALPEMSVPGTGVKPVVEQRLDVMRFRSHFIRLACSLAEAPGAH